nr:SWIM zinc finger family protein [Archangium primigenium]
MVFGECTCNFFQQNKLFRGPCEHLLALRLGNARAARS